ncbi:MAG: hypothetical protein GXN92_02075 [Candidatus Micrarchaeota archaeon]|nr:hypothetical protein [Candidatus Micrarchaeota archaeon]
MKYEVKYVSKQGNVYVLRAWPLEEKLSFKPGQFVMLTYDGIRRPYSIASSPSWEYLEFMITKKEGGQFTSRLDEILGKEIDVQGPFGHMTYEGETKAIFLAAGAGLAPMMSILRYIHEQEIKGDFHLFFSTRTRANHPYQSEFKYWDIDIVERFTREGDSRLSAKDLEGFDLKDYTLFVCGSIPFAQQFKDLGAKKIKVEAWNP